MENNPSSNPLLEEEPPIHQEHLVKLDVSKIKMCIYYVIEIWGFMYYNN